MKYNVTINKRYNYVKVYKVIKKVGETENAFSKAFASFVDKLFAKNPQ